MHLVFAVAFTRKRVVLVKHRVSVSYEDLLLSGLYVTSYKRPYVCPGFVKNFSINFEVSLSDPSIGLLSGYNYENYL